MAVSCTFCRVIEGTQPGSVVYEDELVVAFLDVMPINRGHTLVVPRRHAAYLSEVGPDEGARMFLVAQNVGRALRASKLRCDAVNLFLNDGAEAGQRVFHTHLHVVPRVIGDSLARDLNAEMPTRQDLAAVAEELRDLLTDPSNRS
jgi:diadenosine tetraphosphate (Ap4A) HIT family hydrolase